MRLHKWAAALQLAILASTTHAADDYSFAAPTQPARSLAVYGTTDIDAIEPVIRDFQTISQDVDVRYTHFNSSELYERFLREADDASGNRADVVLSSAMDLQFKLVNDGYALRHLSAETQAVPDWAQWRNEAFGFTHEPVVVVYNTHLLPPNKVPHTRFDLIDLLHDPTAGLKGRVGTYDPQRSAVGYLLFTQDTRQSQLAGVLVEELGDNDVVLESSSARLLQRVEAGELTLAYNVLGSYAQARIDAGAPIGVVMLEDYTLVVSHVAFIARRARNVAHARLFLDYLLSRRGQILLARDAKSFSMRQDVENKLQSSVSVTRLAAPLRPIPLGPGLLVYLDTEKKRQFVESWHRSMRKVTPSLTPQ
jgi:iron(III) transport system substrate-binding protein